MTEDDKRKIRDIVRKYIDAAIAQLNEGDFELGWFGVNAEYYIVEAACSVIFAQAESSATTEEKLNTT